MESRDREKVEAVARLLEAAPPTFVFTQVDFTCKLLGVACSISDECFSSASQSLETAQLPRRSTGFPANLSQRT